MAHDHAIARDPEYTVNTAGIQIRRATRWLSITKSVRIHMLHYEGTIERFFSLLPALASRHGIRPINRRPAYREFVQLVAFEVNLLTALTEHDQEKSAE